MSVTIKSQREIELMRHAGKLLGQTLKQLEEAVRPGMSTWELNQIGEEIIRGYGCIPSFLNYNGYPASICISLNDEVVHGIPRKDRFVENGDIVSLDFCLSYKGYQSDCARTLAIGEISDDAKQLIEVTKQCFFEGIKYAKEGCHLYQISAAINDYADKFGYGVVRDLVGHGIGREMHEDPQIPNFRQRRRGMKLQAGMTLCIEPMINMGKPDIFIDSDDGWTTLTEDGYPSAQWEYTVLVTENGIEILTH